MGKQRNEKGITKHLKECIRLMIKRQYVQRKQMKNFVVVDRFTDQGSFFIFNKQLMYLLT